MSQPWYGRTRRVEGGIKARSTRGAIGESWWSRRFLDVLESLRTGGRLERGRSYARRGQVLQLTVAPGVVKATVQGSRVRPYRVTIKLATLTGKAWKTVERALAERALFGARLLAGEMPHEIEEVFAAAGTPLFPTSWRQIDMECTCPDWEVPCKHIAATFYLLAEAFDDDPFEILHWRGRDRATLLASLRGLRGDPTAPSAADVPPPAVGAAAALADVAGSELARSLDRFWVSPVPLPARPPTVDTAVDLVLRQLPAPSAGLGGPDLVERLRSLYASFAPPSPPPPRS